MTLRIRRLGLMPGLVIGAMLLLPGSAAALPASAPKIGMICAPGSGPGSPHTFNLVAKSGSVDTPDGNSLLIWSYANGDSPDSGQFQFPGPVLCVTQGETVQINLTNNLSEPSSIVFPGQDRQVTATGGSAGLLAQEAAAAGGTVTYSFTAGSPGTYLYESGSNISKQIEMGLYGALVIRPSLGANFAYGASTQFDPTREYLLLLSDLDPDLHHAVETGGTYDMTAHHSRYFPINGREFPDTLQDNGTPLLPNTPYGALVRIQPYSATLNPQPALIRMINVGVLNHPYHPHGNHMTQIAQDGRLLLTPGNASASSERFGETIGSGQTQDYLLSWEDPDHWSPSNPLPVAQPNYRDLTFKGGVTHYSGNPYLGYKGTLPTGTTSLNICGEWYFPWHSHALNEFANFDEPFGGMATLLRVDPLGGCFAFPTSTSIINGLLKTGSASVTALGAADTAYYQVNPKTTTRPTSTTAAQTTITVASATGFPSSGQYYVRIDSEVMRVTGGQGTTTWTVARAQLGTAAATHASGATVSALFNDWYGSFTGVVAGSKNLQVTLQGKSCGVTSTAGSCPAVAAPLPSQTVKICDWTIAGATGCSTATSIGWVTLPAPPTQPRLIGSTAPEPSSTWTITGSGAQYIGTGTYKGQVRVLVHTDRPTGPSPTAFSTWGNVMKIVYDAP